MDRSISHSVLTMDELLSNVVFVFPEMPMKLKNGLRKKTRPSTQTTMVTIWPVFRLCSASMKALRETWQPWVTRLVFHSNIFTIL